MNKTLAVVSLTALMATAAGAETTPRSDADICMDDVFAAYESDLAALLNNIKANLDTEFVAMTSLGAYYSEEQINTIASVCEILTDSNLTAASSVYMDQDGYSLEVHAP